MPLEMGLKTRIVLPGEELGVIEEFIPLRNTYVTNGVIRAKVVGALQADVLRHEVGVDEARRAILPR
ncbi:MAG TPA: RNA-binding protein, partial [Thermofilaceae archaeon]|nr:RNA-binding protein [Thermofilaceae archaeon]